MPSLKVHPLVEKAIETPAMRWGKEGIFLVGNTYFLPSSVSRMNGLIPEKYSLIWSFFHSTSRSHFPIDCVLVGV